jgi:2-oxoisovalerate dehydrogenase E2 component (dihydrolipoyl transacylase)
MTAGECEFALPDLGEGLVSAEIVRWLVDVGDVIAVDQPVAEVETAKTVVEVPSPFAGRVTARHGEEGSEVPVGAVLLTVAVEQPERTAVLVGYGVSAPAAGVEAPSVRLLAREHGIDLGSIAGTGAGGLIRRVDVEAAITGLPDDLVPLRGAARQAAALLTRSRREIPDATCWVDADATALLAARTARQVGLLPLLARLCVLGLIRHPELNASVVTGPDGSATGLRRHREINLGLATQGADGLVVPVIHGAEGLSAADLATRLSQLSAAARAGRLTPADVIGGTFTLNNYGMLGVDGSTPIINHPEAAMLGVGRIADKPWVHDGALAVRPVVQLSLTFDHRVCDGVAAAAFLRFVADAVESAEILSQLL